jgi:hypothetical protein
MARHSIDRSTACRSVRVDVIDEICADRGIRQGAQHGIPRAAALRVRAEMWYASERRRPAERLRRVRVTSASQALAELTSRFALSGLLMRD